MKAAAKSAAKPVRTPVTAPVAEAPVPPARARRPLKPRKAAVPVPAPVPPPEPHQAGSGGSVIQLHRPRVETPTASAIALAAATARLSARRVRDLLPVRIQTRRLVLRAPIRGDVPELVKLADNRNIAQWLSRLPSPYTRADGIAFVEITSQRADERPYAITLEGTGQFIGVVGLSFPVNQPPELGYWLGEPYWGQGYMSEAIRGLLDAAHQTREFPLIRSRAVAENEVSLHLLEKAGFKRVGKEKRAEGPFQDKTLILLELEQPRWT
jgi:RimJ/RimL family protein N-acetyltransferase